MSMEKVNQTIDDSEKGLTDEELDRVNGGAIIYAKPGERTCGTDGDDIIYGTDGDDWIDGGGGNDTIYGGGGNDELEGGWGDDTINGGGGNGVIHDWDGNDTNQPRTHRQRPK